MANKIQLHLKQNKVFFFGMMALTVILTWQVVNPYINTLLVAFVLSFLVQPLYRTMLKLFRNKTGISTGVTVVFSFLVFFSVMFLIGNIMVNQASEFLVDLDEVSGGLELSRDNLQSEKLLEDINGLIDKVPGYEYELTEDKLEGYIVSAGTWLGQAVINTTKGLGSFSANLIPQLVIFLSALSVMIPIFSEIITYIKKLSPLDDDIDQKYIDTALKMAKAMVQGTFVIAITQGIVQALFFGAVGVPYVSFWALIMTLLSLVPLGSGLIAWPIGISLIATGNVWEGIVLLASNTLLVNNIDNILRPKLVPDELEIPSVLVLVSVLGGIQLFGILGVVYGPVVMIMLLTTLDQYVNHYQE